jgi:hypothetical protein
MKADTDAVIDAFGKNEQIKKVFWTLFVAMAGLVMARIPFRSRCVMRSRIISTAVTSESERTGDRLSSDGWVAVHV